MHFRSSGALLVLLGASISVSTNSNIDNGGSRLGLGLSVVEAFSPSYSASRGNRLANSHRPASSLSILYAEADSPSSPSSSADAGADAGAGISMEAGGQLTKSDQQQQQSSPSAASEYRPLQRQWWEVRSVIVARVLVIPCTNTIMMRRLHVLFGLISLLHVYVHVHVNVLFAQTSLSSFICKLNLLTYNREPERPRRPVRPRPARGSSPQQPIVHVNRRVA